MPKIVAQIVIALHDDMSVLLSGNIPQLLIAYGMLDRARDALKARNDQAAADQRIIAPPDGFTMEKNRGA